MRRHLVKYLVLGLVLLLTPAFAMAMTAAWFLNPGGESEVIDGKIGLRSYFYTGDGSVEHPYEIVVPQHFYNLTRLQNLGVFSKETCYFQIGHVFEGEESAGPQCIDTDIEGNPHVTYLNMATFCQSKPLLPIGGEGTPFIGSFDGNLIPVRGLRVAGYPEDIGVFGYVSYEGVVENLVCDDLIVTSLGYTKTQDDSNFLYSAIVEELFNAETANFVNGAGMAFVDPSGVSHPLKQVGTLPQLHINAPANLENGNSTLYKGYFMANFPSGGNPDFTYSWRTSTSLLQKATRTIPDDSEAGSHSIDVVNINMEPLYSSTTFNAGGITEVDGRISLIASITINSIVYSRVIQSYSVTFSSNGSSWEDGNYSMDMYCDYVNRGTQEEPSVNYHHGNNIGLLAGHVDGTMTQCYVYNGTIKFNQETANNYILSETETGLIGEVGKSVYNTISPELGLTDNGDTGIMNLSGIYEMIRSDYVVGQSYYAGQRYDSNSILRYYIAYETGENFTRYQQYLRNDGFGNYLTSASSLKDKTGFPDQANGTYTIASGYPSDINSVDFLWNQVIEDEETVDRGLGVFKIVTFPHAEVDEYDYGDYWRDNLGSSRIINGSTQKTEVFFSTAECDWEKGGGWDANTGGIYPLRMNVLPTYSNVNSFRYPFSRDFNYCFRLNLAEENKPQGMNYMFNTDSPFLTNYLRSILIDKIGLPVPYNTARFGFMFRNSKNEAVTSLSSYIPLGKPDGSSVVVKDGLQYPANSVVFHLEREANVSIVGNNADISIYSYNPDPSKGGLALSEKRTMKSKNRNKQDDHRYFDYSFHNHSDTGLNTNTTAVVAGGDMKDDGALYAHIFRLPYGDYVIGASEKMGGGTANVYFLAVQGQSNAEIGQQDITYLENYVENVDFLLQRPVSPNDVNSFALFSFSGEFDDTMGSVQISTVSGPYLKMTFNNGDSCTTALKVKCRDPNPHYYLNDQECTDEDEQYP